MSSCSSIAAINSAHVAYLKQVMIVTAELGQVDHQANWLEVAICRVSMAKLRTVFTISNSFFFETLFVLLFVYSFSESVTGESL